MPAISHILKPSSLLISAYIGFCHRDVSERNPDIPRLALIADHNFFRRGMVGLMDVISENPLSSQERAVKSELLVSNILRIRSEGSGRPYTTKI